MSPTQRCGRGLEAHSDVRESHPEVRESHLEVCESHPEVREGSECPPGCLGVQPGGPGVVGRPTRRSGRGREAHPSSGMVQEANPEVREGSGGPPGCLGVQPGGPGGVERPTQRSERVREAHQLVREGSGGPTVGPGGVGRTTQRSVSPTRRCGRGLEAHSDVRESHPEVRESHLEVRESHTEVWEGSEGPTGCLRVQTRGPGGVGRTTRRSGRGREAHPKFRDGSGG